MEQTACCIVGAGPAGAILAYILARKGVSVTLLEAHHDFDRDFRGDTIHPSVMDIMDDLGLADRLLELPHYKMQTVSVPGTGTTIDLHLLGDVKYPFVMMVPQSRFLEFMTKEAGRYPNFRLLMGARVEELIEEDGAVRGVRYRSEGGSGEVRATLTVGCDGRFSKLRQLSGIPPIKVSSPIDVMWFRLPQTEGGERVGLTGAVRDGKVMVVLPRGDFLQCGYIIPKGHYQKYRAAGLDMLRNSIASLAPVLADRVDTLQDWKQVAFLSVEMNRLPRWYKPGLLMLGDAAHTMSPVGGVGINYAIQDAVVAANVLGSHLKRGEAPLKALAQVQRKREWPTRIIQAFTRFAQERVIGEALRSKRPFHPPIFLAIPVLRRFALRFIFYGPWAAHVKKPI